MGVDDWAYHKGQRYGTLIVDHERGVPIDLFEGRTAADLVHWLIQHCDVRDSRKSQPGIVTRDRSTDYTLALTQVMPGVQQVADRWHLLNNLHDVVKHIVIRHRGEIEQVWKQQAVVEEDLKIPAHVTVPLPRGAQAREASRSSRARRKARFDQVKHMREQGATISQIARSLDMNRKTARIYFYADVFPERKKNKCIKTSIDPHVAYLQARYDEGCRNVMQLFREIRTQGYTGSYKPVKRWMWLRREVPAPSTAKHLVAGVQQQRAAALQAVNDLPSSCRLAWLLISQNACLSEDDQKILNKILGNDLVKRVYDLAQQFGQMVCERKHEQLDAWLDACATSKLSQMVSFAQSIRSDYSAIKAALSTKWSNGPTEGHINRLKMIKRLMFGRAKFDLLRIRVLHPT